MDSTAKFIENLMKKEITLFHFSFLAWLAYVFRPDVLAPARESIKSVIPVITANTWINALMNLIGLWNLAGAVITIATLIWALLMAPTRKWRDRAELNCAETARVSLGWLVRSSLWWWNLYALQILLSVPVPANVNLYPFSNWLYTYTLVYPCPSFMAIHLVAWIWGTKS